MPSVFLDMIRNFFSDKFFRDNAVFFIGSMVIAVLNYLYHPVLSRMMSVEEFGEVEALLSLTYLTGILLTAFGTIATNIAANHGHHMDDAHRSSLSQIYRLVEIEKNRSDTMYRSDSCFRRFQWRCSPWL